MPVLETGVCNERGGSNPSRPTISDCFTCKQRCLWNIRNPHEGIHYNFGLMVELVDTVASKAAGEISVGVRLPLSPPKFKYSKN